MIIKKIYFLFLMSMSLWAQQEIRPYIGTIKQTEVYMLYRPSGSVKTIELEVFKEGVSKKTQTVTTSSSNDFIAKFHVTGLEANTKYTYEIRDVSNSQKLVTGSEYYFQTLSSSRNIKTKIAFVSCVKSEPQAIFQEMKSNNVNALVLAGDTPYIDSKNLTTIRSKHRAFLQYSTLADLGANRPILGNWDDHDFGLNGNNGYSFKDDKSKTRQGFVEHRAHDQFGDETGGVYHKTDFGVIEIFHLDPRYFSMTEKSPVNSNYYTAFGAVQWNWIKQSLKNSKATFKVLSMGQIWQDKKNSETDDMYTYIHEREALFNFIRDENISGVVIHGGDIHVSRYLNHRRRVGYDLHDFIMSPASSSTISSLNVPHQDLEWSLVESNQYLLMEADGTKEEPTLTITYRKPGQVKKEVKLTLSDLTPKNYIGLSKELRAYYSFDKDFTNQSVLGEHVNAVSSDVVLDEDGVRGKSAKFERSKSSYLHIPKSMLNDNTPKYSISLWIKPTTLPTGSDRAFLFESNSEGKVSTNLGYSISLGLKEGGTNEEVLVQPYAKFLEIPTTVNKAPSVKSSAGINYLPKRADLLNKWTHIVYTYDDSGSKIYVNGAVASASENIGGFIDQIGGLVIGGHREGTGRNFDGLIDEFAVWNRVLTPQEISDYYNEKPDLSVLQLDSSALKPDTSVSIKDESVTFSSDNITVSFDAAENLFTLELSQGSIENIKLYDSLGKVFYKGRSKVFTSKLSKGYYFLEVKTNDNQVFRTNFIKK